MDGCETIVECHVLPYVNDIGYWKYDWHIRMCPNNNHRFADYSLEEGTCHRYVSSVILQSLFVAPSTHIPDIFESASVLSI